MADIYFLYLQAFHLAFFYFVISPVVQIITHRKMNRRPVWLWASEEDRSLWHPSKSQAGERFSSVSRWIEHAAVTRAAIRDPLMPEILTQGSTSQAQLWLEQASNIRPES